MKKLFFLLFPILGFVFFLHYFLVGQAVYGDGIFYWSYTRSLYIDHDLKLNNEISHHYSHTSNNINIKEVFPKEDAKRIVEEYHLPFGASLAWLPFFALGDGIARVVHIFNPHMALNGYSDIYQIAVGIGNILYVLAGLYFVYALLRKFFNQKISIATTILLLFTTNLLYYGSWDLVNSHPFVFFLSSALTYFFFVKFSYKWYQWFFLGAIIGMLILTRTQEVVSGIFLFAGIISYSFSSKNKNAETLLKSIGFGLLGILGVVIVISPQLFLLQDVYHGLFNSPYISSHTFTIFNPHLFGVLVNSKTGLLFTSPIVLVGLFGLLSLARQKKNVGIVGLLFFLSQYYLIASWVAWDQAASYGIRMLISTFTIVAVGTGFCVEKLSRRLSWRVVYVLGLALFIFNVAMIIRFHLSVKTATMDISSVTRIEAQKKLNQALQTHFQFFKE